MVSISPLYLRPINEFEKFRGPQFARELLAGALVRGLVRPPAQQTGAMSETAIRHLVVYHLDRQFMLKWDLFPTLSPVPSTGTTRRPAREAWPAFVRLER